MLEDKISKYYIKIYKTKKYLEKLEKECDDLVSEKYNTLKAEYEKYIGRCFKFEGTYRRYIALKCDNVNEKLLLEMEEIHYSTDLEEYTVVSIQVKQEEASYYSSGLFKEEIDHTKYMEIRAKVISYLKNETEGKK